MFCFDRVSSGVRYAFTDRFGGVSAAPYAELNLGAAAGDDPRAVAENLRRVGAEFGATYAPADQPGDTPADSDRALVLMSQWHGREVAVISADDDLGAYVASTPRVDAVVSAHPNVVLMARVADCVPVLLADPDARVLGAVHSGREGMAVGVVEAAVAAMRDLGAHHVTAIVGPYVCGSCYEVPEELRSRIAAIEPAAYATTSWGTPSLDVGAGVTAQLDRLGVEVEHVGMCTRESDELFSYRRQGAVSGRGAGLIAWADSA